MDTEARLKFEADNAWERVYRKKMSIDKLREEYDELFRAATDADRKLKAERERANA